MPVGFIELEADEVAGASEPDDATLDQLFRRMVGLEPLAPPCPAPSMVENPVVLANLETLTADLRLVTRQMLAELFLTQGGRV